MKMPLSAGVTPMRLNGIIAAAWARRSDSTDNQPSLGAVRNRTAHCATGDRLENWKPARSTKSGTKTPDSKSGLVCPRRFEPWLCELRDGIGGCPERLVLCRADVTEVAVAAFDVVEVVDVVGYGRGEF